ncbi:MAG: aminomethyl transferase family protein [Burkholderiales bacterium]|nr:aminomethyl transferase family protein [Burkholderiales bacterium]
MDLIKRSPYHHKFVAQGATFVDRLGFAAPLVFTSTEEEHRATREAVGVFDVYYQVAVEVAGRDAARFLQEAVVADAAGQPVGRALYTSLCDDSGGMIDDLTCFRLAPDRYWLFPTPSRVEAVVAALTAAAAGQAVVVTNLGYRNAYLSIQGPRSRDLLSALTDIDLSTAALPYYSFTIARVADVPNALLSRTGYSGELGYELFYPVEYAEHVWDRVFAAGASLGVRACGLGALRTLRLEKKYVLYGLDANATTTPLEAGLSWTVKFDKPRFAGKDALAKQRASGPARRLVLIELPTLDMVPPVGAAIAVHGREVGQVTSADRGYSVGKALALGFVESACAQQGQAVTLAGAQGDLPGRIHVKAIYDPEGSRLRC